MAALAEVPPLAVEGGSGWSDADIEEAAALCARVDADASHWALADWLLERVPMGPRGRNGNHARIEELAQRIGVSASTLLGARATADAWPSPTRVPCAAYFVHEKYRNGGATHAAERRERVLSMQRNAAGRVTMPAFIRWRAAQQTGAAPTSPKRRDPPSTKARADLPPAVLELLRQCDRLIEDAGSLVIADALPTSCRPSLDALIAALNGVGEALAQARVV